MKRTTLYVLFFLIFVAASCDFADPYKRTSPSYLELIQEVDSLKTELSNVRQSLELTQDALRIQGEYTSRTDSVILERIKYLYATK